MRPEDAFALMVDQGDMVLDRLDACCRVHPDKTFIIYGEDDITLSFAAFRQATDRLAAGLARLGVGADDRVSVFTRNSLVAALAMFAIWRAGGVYAPINFNFKGQLLGYQLKDTAPKLLITDINMAGVLAELADDLALPPVVMHHPRPGDHDDAGATMPTAGLGGAPLHDLADLLATDAAPPVVIRRYGDIANIVYTSGTTGPSKGVMQSFRWMNQYNFLLRSLNNADDVLYCDLPLYHVGGAFSQFVRAVWHGCTVGLWDRFSPNRFWRRIDRCGATVCVLLDVMVPWLMSAEPDTRDRENTLNKVHMQPLPTAHHQVARRFGFDFTTAGFGQTESGAGFLVVIDQFGAEAGTPPDLYRGLSKDALRTAVRDMNLYMVDGAAPTPKGLMGRPSPLLETAVLDPEDNICPPGVVGQLAFRSRFPSTILTGYLNKPEKTLEAFRNQWFHTGDAISRDADGIHYFVDRMGGFFRVRGENVSSFEVEDLINSHPSIRVAAALPVPAREGGEEDIGVFVELVEGATLSLDALRAHCAAVMPRYMVPHHLRIIDALPLTPTGKIEKYKLRQQLLAEIEAAASGRLSA
ncbi:AMP-binding protein (plasmid) [Tistrella bauzanensis]|uniref:class I adenylate-forming enzyme family protein n=1 Tax=Tistrella TaxID=171436 RepID=UPI0031F6B1E5